MIGTTSRRFLHDYDENSQSFRFEGIVRFSDREVQDTSLTQLQNALHRAKGNFIVDLQRVRRMNLKATKAIADVIIRASEQNASLSLRIVTSSVLPWIRKRFAALLDGSNQIVIKDYDEALYPGQGVLEDESFVQILRTQTKLTWRHEKDILPRHGLREGMRVADICCGIGDFAALISRTFAPTELVAVDHSRPSLDYARRAAADLGIHDVAYVYGDATNLIIKDNCFDFVTCRHSLQVFDRPSLILSELRRICVPGGRVYITNEKNSHCLGEPRANSIRWTYDEVARLWSDFGMDIELGPKSRRLMLDAGFEDVLTECFIVTNLDGDPRDFADVIASWESVYVDRMAVERGDGPEFIERFRRGFRDHVATALDSRGYATWPIWVVSGRKPT
jgi:ubiquinone/menaquinone biosynthesis C-methylase UbiE